MKPSEMRSIMHAYSAVHSTDVKEELDSGKSMDLFLDETDIFDDFEKLLPDEEYPIFVITILNGFKSDDLLDKLVNDIYGNKYKK